MHHIALRTACAWLCALAGTAAWAQAPAGYPAKTITLVVPFPAGGHTDAIARLVAEQLGKRLGQSVVIDNRPGVNGSLGTDAVTRAAPDGYTLVMSGVGAHAINPAVNPNVKYDARRDFTHIALLTRSPNVLLASPGFKGTRIQDVVAMSKAAPRSLNFALTGIGSSGHLAMELLKQAAGVDFNAVPYKGDAPATVDLLGGQVDLLFVNSVVALPHIKAGKLRPLAVTGATRNPMLPEVPTMAETVHPSAVAESWTGVAGPAGVPTAVTELLNREINAVLAMPELRDKLAASGTVVMPSSVAETSAFVRNEVEKWGAVVKAGNMRAE